MLSFLSRTWVLGGLACRDFGHWLFLLFCASGFWRTVARYANDTAYPLAYGGLLTGLIWRLAGSLREWLVRPAIAAIIADLTENMTQAVAPSDDESFIGLKDVLTPVKFGLFSLAAVLALVSLVLAGIRLVRNRGAA